VIPDLAQKHVTTLKSRGLDIDIFEINIQCYVIVRSVAAPSPPWDRSGYDILIAMPVAYDDAGLDGFYLSLPYKYADGQHKRVNGGRISLLDREWQLVSWHYPDGKPWQSVRDSLETHITHCRGFFLHRGARNDYN
jgi:hypothetical protein